MARVAITEKATKESRRKGALAANAVRRERAKSFRERLQAEVDERYDEVTAPLFNALKSSDEKTAVDAAVKLIVQSHGMPTGALEITHGGKVEHEHKVVSAVAVLNILQDAGAFDGFEDRPGGALAGSRELLAAHTNGEASGIPPASSS